MGDRVFDPLLELSADERFLRHETWPSSHIVGLRAHTGDFRQASSLALIARGFAALASVAEKEEANACAQSTSRDVSRKFRRCCFALVVVA
jgi:hypothetical protein